MTLVTSGSDDIIEQITKHLNKLVEVVKLLDLTEGPHIERELMMIKLRAEQGQREEVKGLVDIFRGNIIDVTDSSYIVELTGTVEKLDAFVEAVHEDLIVEVVRTGPSGIARGAKGLRL
jgi:acetolactate synthase-1/3 small subunit